MCFEPFCALYMTQLYRKRILSNSLTDSSANTESSASNSHAYCADRVRRLDHDRYLSALLAPAASRAALFALYAFNIEIAGVREAVSEPMLGEIRLQWWREAIEGIYSGAPRRHAVVMVLSGAVSALNLSRTLFDAMIDARAFDLGDSPPDTLVALEDYAAATSGNLNQLALQVLGADGTEAAAAGRHAGIAWALIGLLRAVRFHAGQRRCYLPADLMAAAGAGTAQLFSLKGGDGLREVARRIADCASGHMEQARALRHAVPRDARSPVLSLVLADAYLHRMERTGFELFAKIEIGSLSRQARMTMAALRGRY